MRKQMQKVQYKLKVHNVLATHIKLGLLGNSLITNM